MDIKTLLTTFTSIEEGTMDKAKTNATGSKFGGYWKGTDVNPPKFNQGVGGEGKENLLKSYERELKEQPTKQLARSLFKEYAEYQLNEYGGTGAIGARSEAPTGTTTVDPNSPEAKQAALDKTMIQKGTNNLAPTLNAQGGSDPINTVKLQDVMSKLNTTPNTQLSNQEQNQTGQLAVAASKIIQNPQTASKFKSLITQADQLVAAKQAKLKQQQQAVGTNTSTQPTTQTGQQPGGAVK